MTASEVDRDVVEFVRLGYHNASLHFLVRVRNRATFDAVVEAAGRYKTFDPRKVMDTIGSVFDDADLVEFGRENDAVVYLGIPYFPNQRRGYVVDKSRDPGRPYERYTDEQRHEMTLRVIEWAKSVGADEITVQQFPPTPERVWNEPGDNPYLVRVRWD